MKVGENDILKNSIPIASYWISTNTQSQSQCDDGLFPQSHTLHCTFKAIMYACTVPLMAHILGKLLVRTIWDSCTLACEMCKLDNLVMFILWLWDTTDQPKLKVLLYTNNMTLKLSGTLYTIVHAYGSMYDEILSQR